MPLGPAISYRGSGADKFQAVYALPGDTTWRTVAVEGRPHLFDSASQAEAIAGHVLCAKLWRMPVDLEAQFRADLRDLLDDLIDLQAAKGGCESPVWARVEKMRERLAEQPAKPRLVKEAV